MIVGEWLFRLLGGAVLVALILLLGGVAIVALDEGIDYLKKFTTNTSYAEIVFGGLVPYDEVLDSQKHRGLKNRCVSVVVRLSDHAPKEPPSRTDRPWGTNFGGEWKKGPSPWFVTVDGFLKDGLRASPSAIRSCGTINWDEDLYARVKAAALDSETWWTELHGNQIYSKRHKLAVLIYWQPL